MLLYEKEILNETKGESFVLISSYGLHLNNVINLNIMFYLNKYSFTFLLNFEESTLSFTHEYFCNMKNLDKQARKKKYLKGGVFFCSSRVLLTDFLENNIPIELISAIIVKNADKIKENSIEAFILHVYRKNSSKGLIKAFSSNCIPFSYGIGSMEKFANTLKCINFVLYPRFHKNVINSFKEDGKFLQHEFKLTEEMIEIQMILIEILKELIKLYKIDVDYELVLLSKAYITKQCSDILDIKYLILLLFSCNLDRFYMECLKFIYKQIDLGKESTWLNSSYTFILIDKIEIFYIENEQFVCDQQKEIFKDLKKNLQHKKVKREEKIFNVKNQKAENLNLEKLSSHNQKFVRLLNLIQKSPDDIFIVVLPSSTILFDVENQLESLKTKIYFFTKKDFLSKDLYFSENTVKKDFISMNQKINESVSVEKFYIFYVENSNCEISKDTDNKDLKGLYFKKDKKYQIILYDKDLACIRKCEYIGTKIEIIVHSFQFRDSIEEQINLLSLRKEKLYFEQLINKKSKMPIILDPNKNIIEDEFSDEMEINYDVIVDSRELRADLPFFLYKAGNNIIVDTLQIGDYLINENICIERKNINDFISSINTGRLYNQIRMLTFYYQKAVLLLEFNSRPCLSDFYNHNLDTFRNSLISKFCLFLITFPIVSIIWSESSLFTTKTIRRLQNKDIEEEERFKVEIDPILQEILLSVPGINQFNIRKITKNFKNIKELVNSSKENLKRKIGEDKGLMIYNFFNDPFTDIDI